MIDQLNDISKGIGFHAEQHAALESWSVHGSSTMSRMMMKKLTRYLVAMK